jgi:GNAT superfamily N-acetyltransferase
MQPTRSRLGQVIAIRRATAVDSAFLYEMLAVAVDWRRETPRPATDVVAEPGIAKYVVGWPRDGDVGFIAEEGSVAVGAAWWRTFGTLDAGYGFVDEFTPEVSIGVVHRARRRGVGRELLQALIQEAKRAGVPALSLSVEADNPAASLYRRLGFAEVSNTGGATTMALRLMG